ncbi:hypothetical protein PybrP1_007304 [[Pythium] brassicae (nom. inval.)]|nr:hypothetical protein PybrP1_007304 [[Pythium] brassicae (nom. inval.)]
MKRCCVLGSAARWNERSPPTSTPAVSRQPSGTSGSSDMRRFIFSQPVSNGRMPSIVVVVVVVAGAGALTGGALACSRCSSG